MIGDFGGAFEMTCYFVIGEQNQTTAMRFKNFEQYKCYINKIDKGYDDKHTNIFSNV